MARLQDKYTKEIVPALARSSAATNRSACRSCRRSSSTWASARRCRTRTGWSRRPSSSALIAGQKPQITKAKRGRQRLPPPRGQRDRLPGHAPRQADVRVPRPADQRRPAAYPRLPRRQPEELRRQRQLQHGPDRAAGLPRDRPGQGDFTQGMDITFVTSTRNDDEARELLRLFGMPFREA